MARFLATSILEFATFARSSARSFTPIHAKRTLLFTSIMKRTMAYSTYESGAANTLDFRMYFRKYSLKINFFGAILTWVAIARRMHHSFSLWLVFRRKCLDHFREIVHVAVCEFQVPIYCKLL